MKAKENNMCYGVDMNEEIWKDIPGFEGLYQASNWGRVRSLDRVVTRKDGRKQLYKGKLLKIQPNGIVGLIKDRVNSCITLKYIIAGKAVYINIRA